MLKNLKSENTKYKNRSVFFFKFLGGKFCVCFVKSEKKFPAIKKQQKQEKKNVIFGWYGFSLWHKFIEGKKLA